MSQQGVLRGLQRKRLGQASEGRKERRAGAEKVKRGSLVLLLERGSGRAREGVRVEAKSVEQEAWRHDPVQRIRGEEHNLVRAGRLTPDLLTDDHGKGVEEANCAQQTRDADPILSFDDSEDGNQVVRELSKERSEAHAFQPHRVHANQGIGAIAPGEHQILFSGIKRSCQVIKDDKLSCLEMVLSNKRTVTHQGGGQIECWAYSGVMVG